MVSSGLRPNVPSTVLPQKLAELRGACVYVVPLVDDAGQLLGNNGDLLMEWCMAHLLREAGLATVEDPLAADVVVVPPNGGLLERYSFPAILARRIAPLAAKPLLVLPSSAWFPTEDPTFMFANRSAPTILFLREPASFDHLTNLWGRGLADSGVQLELDHDVTISTAASVADAFWAKPSDRLHRLVAMRTDSESMSRPDAATEPTGAPARVRQSIGTSDSPVARVLQRQLARYRSRHLGHSAVDLLGMPRSRSTVFADVSNNRCHTYQDYVSTIATSREVITDRLHVAIPAALAGIPVVVLPNSYHKVRSVVEHSLGRMENVRVVSPDK